MLIKKILIVNLIIIMLMYFCFPLIVEGKTLNDLDQELKTLEKKEAENQANIKNTEAEINQTKKDINDSYVEMDNISAEIIAKNKEIEDLSIKIELKDQETKDLMKFLQASNGGSVYLDYIMGAENLSDFVYRLSIIEQLTRYNSDLIKEMGDLITANESRKVELKEKEQALIVKQAELKQKVDSLGSKRSNLYEYSSDLTEEIKTSKQVIKMYKDAGCKANDNINTCANKLLPPDTRFWRPLIRGYVSSEYGNRFHPIDKVWRMHDGIDLSDANKDSTRVYAAANGKVAHIGYDNSRGNYIVIHHNINNIKYTTTYLHLKGGSINVNKGSIVSKDTVLATMGTTGSSTGEHLHFSIANGLWFQDYVSYYDFVNKTINPRIYVNFPSIRVYWYDRVTKY